MDWSYLLTDAEYLFCVNCAKARNLRALRANALSVNGKSNLKNNIVGCCCEYGAARILRPDVDYAARMALPYHGDDRDLWGLQCRGTDFVGGHIHGRKTDNPDDPLVFCELVGRRVILKGWCYVRDMANYKRKTKDGKSWYYWADQSILRPMETCPRPWLSSTSDKPDCTADCG